MRGRIARAIQMVAVFCFAFGLVLIPFLVSAIRDGIIIIK